MVPGNIMRGLNFTNNKPGSDVVRANIERTGSFEQWAKEGG
jgi:hypothetical protein